MSPPSPSTPEVPVVMIHGWGGSFRETWHDPGIDALLADSGRKVVGLDLLGHGDADKPHDPAAYADLSGWLLQQLDGIGKTVDVVAFSLGAMTALGAMIREPARFRKVVLAGIGDTTFEPRNEEQHRRILAALDGDADDGDTVALLFSQYAHRPGNDPAALAAIMRRPETSTLVPADLSEITAEVLVAIGDRDFAAPAERLAASFPAGRLVTLRNIDHFATPSSFPFIDAMLEFLGDEAERR